MQTRRDLLRGVAVGTGATLLGGAAAGDEQRATVAAEFDRQPGAVHEAAVVCESNAAVDRIADAVEAYRRCAVLPVGFALVADDALDELAAVPGVRRVEPNVRMERANDGVREAVGASAVGDGEGLAAGYDGRRAHAAVVDTGVDADHPDLDVAAHYRWAGLYWDGDYTLWVPAGDADTDGSGHGTHCCGTLAGDGTASRGRYRGVAPRTRLTVYSASAGGLALFATVAAYDHLLERVRDGETDVDVVSNSYAPAGGGTTFDPDGALETASWRAYRAGVLSVFAAGNDGPGRDTMSRYAAGPHVLGVGATDREGRVADFSSRGRVDGPHDRAAALDALAGYHDSGTADGPVGLYRPGVTAPGVDVVSAMSPADAYRATTGRYWRDGSWYGTLSGTSMAAPAVAGVAALVVDAHRRNGHGSPTPLSVLRALEATARDRSEEGVVVEGAGFVDAVAAVERAEDGF